MANPYLLAAIPGVLSGLSGFLGGQSQQNLTQQQFAAEQARLEKERIDRLLQAERDAAQRQGENALNATQMDPLKQQKSRQLNALVSSLLAHSTTPTMDAPGSGLKYNGADFASFFTPEARSNAEAGFNANAHTATGGQYVPQMGVGNTGPTYPLTPQGTVPGLRPQPVPVVGPQQQGDVQTRDTYANNGVFKYLQRDRRKPSPTLQQLLTQPGGQ